MLSVLDGDLLVDGEAIVVGKSANGVVSAGVVGQRSVKSLSGEAGDDRECFCCLCVIIVCVYLCCVFAI